MITPPPPTAMPSVGLHIDILPIALWLSLLLCLLCLFSSSKHVKAYDHKTYGTLGTICLIAGLILMNSREFLPMLYAILFGNCLILAGLSLLACAARLRISRPITWPATIGIGATLTFSTAYFCGADVELRAKIVAVAASYTCTIFAISFMKHKRKWFEYFAIGIAAFVAMAEGARAFLLYHQGIASATKTNLNKLSVILGVILALSLTVATVSLHWPALRKRFATLTSPKPQAEADPPFEQSPTQAQDGCWTLHPKSRELRAPNGTALRLTASEYLVLNKLREVDDIVDRLTLNAVLGRSEIDPKDRAIDILISRLRRKCLNEDLILPINALRGRGYVFMGKIKLQ